MVFADLVAATLTMAGALATLYLYCPRTLFTVRREASGSSARPFVFAGLMLKKG